MSPIISTFSAASARGYGWDKRVVVSSGTEPEYWWRADSGLSTSTWTAYAGGLDFTLFNVASANSTTGLLLNGTNGYGTTANLSTNIDAKHIFIRTDSIAGTAGQTILGGSQNNIHEWYFTNDVDDWYIVEMTSAGAIVYAASGGVVGSSITWVDFTNYEVPAYFLNTSNVSDGSLAVYSGIFPNRFRWLSGFNIQLGRRSAGSYLSGYVKEVAIFTTSLTDAQAKTFRSGMASRWP